MINIDKIDILSLSLNELEEKLLEMGEQKFRGKQIFEWLHKKNVSGFPEMTNLSEKLREKLEDIFFIQAFNIIRKQESALDGTVKYLFQISDENKIETVLMNYKHGNSLCISTQVGCKMGCKFCASGIAGFVRNLTAGEMLGQIYAAERDSNREVGSIVLMGIGEPLDNFENVVRFLQLLSDKNGREMSLRHVSLSTCGLADKIYKLAEYDFPLTLSVSLHATDDKTRNSIMPINKKHNINELLRACDFYFEKTGRRISYEYAVIKDVNDSDDDAALLAKLLKNKNAHINLIPVNQVSESGFQKSSAVYVKRFAEILQNAGINATIRRTLGSDIDAACGQLRRDNM